MNPEIFDILNTVIFAAGDAYAAEGASDGSTVDKIIKTFKIKGEIIAAQIIIILILWGVLHTFAFGPILQMLDERKKKIAEGLDNATKVKEQLEEAEKERAEIVRKANEQAGEIIEEARKSAETIGAKKVEEATSQAEGIVSKAREAAEADREKVLNEVKAEVGKLVVATTSKVVGKVITGDDEKRLQQEAVTAAK